MLNCLHEPWAKRCEYVASISERYPEVFDFLYEGVAATGEGWIDDENNKVRTTSVIDALTLLEEDHRATQESV